MTPLCALKFASLEISQSGTAALASNLVMDAKNISESNFDSSNWIAEALVIKRDEGIFYAVEYLLSRGIELDLAIEVIVAG